MTAGNVLIGRVWDYDYDTYGDDEVGGAVPTGTVLQEGVELRIMSLPPTQALIEQGVESLDIYRGRISKHTVDIQNNNEIEITAPYNSPYFGKHFRVMGDPQRTSTHTSDSRGFLMVTLRRVERSRTVQ